MWEPDDYSLQPVWRGHEDFSDYMNLGYHRCSGMGVVALLEIPSVFVRDLCVFCALMSAFVECDRVNDVDCDRASLPFGELHSTNRASNCIREAKAILNAFETMRYALH